MQVYLDILRPRLKHVYGITVSSYLTCPRRNEYTVSKWISMGRELRGQDRIVYRARRTLYQRITSYG